MTSDDEARKQREALEAAQRSHGTLLVGPNSRYDVAAVFALWELGLVDMGPINFATIRGHYWYRLCR